MSDIERYLDDRDLERLEEVRIIESLEGYGRNTGDENAETPFDPPFTVRLPEPGPDSIPTLVTIYNAEGVVIATFDPVTGKRTNV